MKTGILPFLLATTALCAEPALQDAVRDFQSGDLEGAKAILEKMALKEPKNQAVQAYLKQIAEKQAGSAAMQKKLNAAVIPKVEFLDVDARQAFEFLCQLVQKHGGFRPNLVWSVPDSAAGKVTLSLENIPGGEAMRYAAETAGLKITFEELAVRVQAPEARRL